MGLVHLRERFVEARLSHQEFAIPVVCRGIAGVKFDRAFKLLLGARPVPIVNELHPGERGMRFGKGVIELERFRCGGFYPRPNFFCRQYVVVRQKRVGIGQAGVGQSIARVLLNSLLEIVDALLHAARVLLFHSCRPCRYN